MKRAVFWSDCGKIALKIALKKLAKTSLSTGLKLWTNFYFIVGEKLVDNLPKNKS